MQVQILPTSRANTFIDNFNDADVIYDSEVISCLSDPNIITTFSTLNHFLDITKRGDVSVFNISQNKDVYVSHVKNTKNLEPLAYELSNRGTVLAEFSNMIMYGKDYKSQKKLADFDYYDRLRGEYQGICGITVVVITDRSRVSFRGAFSIDEDNGVIMALREYDYGRGNFNAYNCLSISVSCGHVDIYKILPSGNIIRVGTVVLHSSGSQYIMSACSLTIRQMRASKFYKITLPNQKDILSCEIKVVNIKDLPDPTIKEDISLKIESMSLD